MQLILLDASFQVIKYIKYINLQWVRRYYEPGEFSVQIPASEYVSGCAYLYTKDRPELGIIQKTEYTAGYDGELMQLSGYFYEYKLNDKITFPPFRSNARSEVLARTMVYQYKDDIPLLQLGDDHGLGSVTAKDSVGEGLASAIYPMLQSQELSYRCVYDHEAGTMTFDVWQGKDRTQDQSENSFATFGDRFRNLQNEKVTMDSSAAKNYAVVIGNGSYSEGSHELCYVDRRADASDYKKVVFVDQSATMFDDSTQTLGEYMDVLKQAGEEALDQCLDVTNIQFDTIDGKGITYLTDYDLGDRCDIILDSIHLSFTARITEIAEVFKAGKHAITLQFGDKVPTVYNKSRR